MQEMKVKYSNSPTAILTKIAKLLPPFSSRMLLKKTLKNKPKWQNI